MDESRVTDYEYQAAMFKHYGEGLPPASPDYGFDSADMSIEGWSSGVRAEVKDEICNNLAQATGLSYEAVNKAIRQWADSSNDTDMRSLSMQEAAARVFGTELSAYQQRKMNNLKASPSLDERYNQIMFQNDHEPYPTPQAAQDAFLKAMHADTQQRLTTAGITHVTLYRGVTSDFRKKGIKPGSTVSVREANAMESWTIHPGVAKGFDGDVIKAEVPIERVLATARNGYGCLNEYEFIVLGGNADDKVTAFATSSW